MESKQDSAILDSASIPSIDYVFLSVLSPISFFPDNSLDTSSHSFRECNNSRQAPWQIDGKRCKERGKFPGKSIARRTLRPSSGTQLLLVYGPGQSRATLNYLAGALVPLGGKVRGMSPRGNFQQLIEN